MNRVVVLTTSLLFVLATLQVDAQDSVQRVQKPAKRSQTTVSELSKQQFTSDFGNVANAKWSTTDYYDRVYFTGRDGKKMTAFYSPNGMLVATSYFKDVKDLPPKAMEQINSTYKDFKLDSVYFIDYKAAKGGVMYYGFLLESDNYFVMLTRGEKTILLKVDLNGGVSFFKYL